MTKTFNCALYLLCVLFFTPLFAENNQIIDRLDIVVHTGSGATVESQSVLPKMSTKQGAFFSQTEFDEDLKTLSLDYDRIEPTIEVNEDKVLIRLDLWPKPVIRSIQWRGNAKMPTRTLQKELAVSCFSIYERQSFNLAFHKLKAFYIKKGFFEAELDYHVTLDPNTNEVDIVIDVKEGRSGKIQEIVFEGFCEREQSELLKQMATKKYNIFLSWLTEEGAYHEEAIQQDQMMITSYLQNEGYADAQVDISVTESTVCDRIIVTITADRGELYSLGQLSFEGNQIIPNDVIDRLFPIRRGDAYSLEDIRETITLITDTYGKLGYIDAIVDFEPELVESEHIYNVHFRIEEGSQYYVGLIRVFGNCVTQPSVILHETLLKPGELFNSVKLKRSEQRLQNMGYFKNVNVYIVKGSESSSLPGNYRDVYIEVEETNTGQFSAFTGASSGAEAGIEIFGGVSLTEKNFNANGLGRFFRDGFRALRGGGEYAHLTAQIGQKSRSYVFSWTKPHFMDTKWAVGFDINKTSTRYISKDYDLESAGLYLRATYDVNQFVRTGYYYRLKNSYANTHIHDDVEEAREEHDREELKGLYQLRREAHIHGLISAVGATWIYNSSNHPVKPTNGFISKLQIEYAGVGGDHTFFSVGYLNTYLFPVGSRAVIKYRADMRFIQPTGSTHYATIPLDERIFLGGDFMVRGYRPYRLGPQYEGSHIPRGGLSMQLFSVEFNRRIMEDIEAFMFMDAGYLSKKKWDFGRMSVAVGYGARFKIIPSIPEITMGMGYPLNPQNRSEVKKFFISVGGQF